MSCAKEIEEPLLRRSVFGRELKINRIGGERGGGLIAPANCKLLPIIGERGFVRFDVYSKKIYAIITRMSKV